MQKQPLFSLLLIVTSTSLLQGCPGEAPTRRVVVTVTPEGGDGNPEPDGRRTRFPEEEEAPEGGGGTTTDDTAGGGSTTDDTAGGGGGTNPNPPAPGSWKEKLYACRVTAHVALGADQTTCIVTKGSVLFIVDRQVISDTLSVVTLLPDTNTCGLQKAVINSKHFVTSGACP